MVIGGTVGGEPTFGISKACALGSMLRRSTRKLRLSRELLAKWLDNIVP